MQARIHLLGAGCCCSAGSVGPDLRLLRLSIGFSSSCTSDNEPLTGTEAEVAIVLDEATELGLGAAEFKSVYEVLFDAGLFRRAVIARRPYQWTRGIKGYWTSEPSHRPAEWAAKMWQAVGRSGFILYKYNTSHSPLLL